MKTVTNSAIILCATGVDDLTGGIASANRNLLAALRQLGTETGVPVRTITLAGRRNCLCGKLTFAFEVSLALMRERMLVFDHVQLALPALILCNFRRAGVVICGHGSEIGKRIRPSSKRTLAAADLVITNSKFTLQNMRETLGTNLGTACQLGLPLQSTPTLSPPAEEAGMQALAGLRLRAADGREQPVGAKAMLLVGRLDAAEREKGHRELIGALPSIVQAVPEAQLIFVGGGSDEAAVRNLAAASPVAANIFVTGRLTQSSLERLYLAAYAYVMPSRQEGFGLVYLEAMNFAKPCIACRGDGGGEIVVDGETGLLVDQPIRQEQLVGVIVQLLGDTAMARRMGLAGWRRLNEEFSAKAHQARIIKLLRPVLLAKRPGQADDRASSTDNIGA